MDVVSICPLRVAKAVFQPRPGAFALIVACKATYDLQPTLSPLAGLSQLQLLVLVGTPVGDDELEKLADTVTVLRD